MLIKKIGRANLDLGKNKRYFQVSKVSDFSRLQWRASYISKMV